MIKEITRLQNKYKKLSKHSEYVDIQSVINDLYHLAQDCRLKRVPKEDR